MTLFLVFSFCMFCADFIFCAQPRSARERNSRASWYVPVSDVAQNFVTELDSKSLIERKFSISALQEVIQQEVLSTGHQAADDYNKAVQVIDESLKSELPARVTELKEQELRRIAQANGYPFYPDVSMSRLCAQELSDVGSIVRSAGIAAGTAATGIAVAALRYPQAFKTGYEMVEARAKYILTGAIAAFGLWRVLANISKYHAFEVDRAVIENQLGNVDTNTLVQNAIIDPLQQSLIAQRTAVRVEGLAAQLRQVQSELLGQGRRSAVIHREVTAGRKENAKRFASVRTGVGCVERRMEELARALGVSAQELREQIFGVGQRVDGVAGDVASLHDRLDDGAAALRGMEERLRGDIVRAVVAASMLSSSETKPTDSARQTSSLVGLVLEQMTRMRRTPRLPDSSRPEEE